MLSNPGESEKPYGERLCARFFSADSVETPLRAVVI